VTLFRSPFFVMAGLVPAIRVSFPRREDVDAREERGHDDREMSWISRTRLR